MHELYDHADSLFNALLSGLPSPALPVQPKPFVTFSREAGSGASSVARALARRLNGRAPAGVTWRVIENQITSLTLKEQGLPADIARYLPEDKTPEFLAMLGELVGLHPAIWGLIEKVHAMQRKLAETGHVILVGRAAHLATARLPGGLHVRTIASKAFRIKTLTEMHHLSEEQATRHVNRCDRARRLYAAQHYSARLESPHQYDLVLNMEKMSPAQAVEVIAQKLASTEAAWVPLPALAKNDLRLSA